MKWFIQQNFPLVRNCIYLSFLGRMAAGHFSAALDNSNACCCKHTSPSLSLMSLSSPTSHLSHIVQTTKSCYLGVRVANHIPNCKFNSKAKSPRTHTALFSNFHLIIPMISSALYHSKTVRPIRLGGIVWNRWSNNRFTHSVTHLRSPKIYFSTFPNGHAQNVLPLSAHFVLCQAKSYHINMAYYLVVLSAQQNV